MKPNKSDAAKKTGPQTGNQPPATKTSGVQGEGNYAAAREFDEAERRFVASGKVPAAAAAAAPRSDAEEREMIEAEEAGKRRAKK